MFVYIVTEAVRRTKQAADGAVVTLKNMHFKRPVFLDTHEETKNELLVRLLQSSLKFEVYLNRDFSMCVSYGDYEFSHDGDGRSEVSAPTGNSDKKSTFYEQLKVKGYYYGDSFRRVTTTSAGHIVSTPVLSVTLTLNLTLILTFTLIHTPILTVTLTLTLTQLCRPCCVHAVLILRRHAVLGPGLRRPPPDSAE